MMDLTAHWVGLTALTIFVIAYVLVISEEFTKMRKSKPVMLAAGILWALVGYEFTKNGLGAEVEEAVGHFLLEFAQLFLFLLVAMTYVNAMTERRVFRALRNRLASRGYSYKKVFWITGVTAFFLSPLIDNLTTALVMCAVVLAVGQDNKRFVGVACINIVVAANAGGAFSPFGDITTLMVWQSGLVEFHAFLSLFVPSVVNFLVPAFLMSLAVSSEPTKAIESATTMNRGAKTIVGLFGCTIATAVSFHYFFNLPPFLGMMTGLAYLKFYGYYLRITHIETPAHDVTYGSVGEVSAFDTFREVAMVEWDTLLFFFGVIMSVGALGFIGYLDHLALFLYGELGNTVANVLIGVISAVIDNIPVMVAVLEMHPTMGIEQWLLVTLTAGVGGSLLSIGSAAGVALMGQARGNYTFFTHLKWTPAIALGYASSIVVHLWISNGLAFASPG